MKWPKRRAIGAQGKWFLMRKTTACCHSEVLARGRKNLPNALRNGKLIGPITVACRMAIKAEGLRRIRFGSSPLACESCDNRVKLAGRFFQALGAFQNDSAGRFVWYDEAFGFGLNDLGPCRRMRDTKRC